MPQIQNVAAADIPQGFHYACGNNSMLIQIADPCGWFPSAQHSFKETHRFEFLDLNKGETGWDEFGITEDQAKEIVALLQRALDENLNVVVHCTAGICRSGAVVEVAVMMGFEDPEVYRAPNLLVKHRLMKELGWLYDEQETHYTKHEQTEEDVMTSDALAWYRAQPSKS